MDTLTSTSAISWPLWRKIIFRFAFVYLTFFQIEPWSWLNIIPGVHFATDWYDNALTWLSQWANKHYFHFLPLLDTVPNGSGDTSYSWAILWVSLVLSAIACIVWSAIDWQRVNYTRLNYWLCLITRYSLATIAFSYGGSKLFCLQMPFPNLHQLATPLGDLLPMRFSWLFIGYSKPYEIFSGVMEIFAGSLLLFRRTATLGAMVATGVFLNVMMLNLCYDIPVKIYSIQLTAMSLFLLLNESKRIIDFFILNKPAVVGTLYHYTFPKKWMRVTAIVAKVLFILAVVASPLYDTYQYATAPKHTAKQIVKNGVYEVVTYKVNNTALPLALSDTIRWQDVVLEDGLGSAKTSDTAFVQRYKRGYFSYVLNDTTHTFVFKKHQTTSPLLNLSMRYELPDSNTIKLWGKKGNDSLYVELKRTKRHFQLAERQFHWFSERNR